MGPQDEKRSLLDFYFQFQPQKQAANTCLQSVTLPFSLIFHQFDIKYQIISLHPMSIDPSIQTPFSVDAFIFMVRNVVNSLQKTFKMSCQILKVTKISLCRVCLGLSSREINMGTKHSLKGKGWDQNLLVFLSLVPICPTIIIQTLKTKHLTMLSLLFVLSLLWLSHGQSYIARPPTLLQLSKQNTTKDALQQKAIEFVLKAHPELWNYTVVAISNQINRGNQTYADNLKDYLFELESKNITILAMVTLSDLPEEEFVSVSPLVTRNSQNGRTGDFFITRTIPPPPHPPIMNQTISSDLKKGAQRGSPPGSYLPFPNLQDPLLQYSLDYVASLHPNIVNYNLKETSYQIVAGINIKLEYDGLDNFSQIETIISFNLSVEPQLTAFKIDCVDDSKDSGCAAELAWDFYHGIEGVILVHPELLSYRIVSFMLQPSSGNSSRAMLTFENKKLGLRSLSEISVDSTKLTILSFFTYQYAAVM